jgi:GH43 family beta-xylosidase
MPAIRLAAGETFVNPVYERSFPDPFVLLYRGEYYAYCTGTSADGRVFRVLHSPDLVNWEEVGGAMKPLDESHPHYWAPEVTHHNGKFYLYYSVGNETLMQIRVAISDRPEGGFIDCGHRLTDEEFAIDPHVVKARDGQWYMFYATDFLEHTHIGTGTVVDRMLGPFSLEHSPRPVTRARYDWQVYDPERKEKGGVRWHTVEGPFVLERKGTFYQMFSGGNWQNETYGVSFATSRTLLSDSEWEQHSDGETTRPILMTIPKRIVGPGHNSAVKGPNGRELYCVYHRWTESGRVMAVDRLDFAGGDRMFIVGPTDTPQPVPYRPLRLTDPSSRDRLQMRAGSWAPENGYLNSAGPGIDELFFPCKRGTDLRCSLSFRFREKKGSFSIQVRSSDIDLFTLSVEPDTPTIWAEWPGSGGRRTLPVPADLDVTAAHQITIDIEHEGLRLTFDDSDVTVNANLPAQASGLSFTADEARVELGPVDVTFGFEELFQVGDIIKRGWDHYNNRGALLMEDGLLKMIGEGDNNAVISKRVTSGDHVLNVNLRAADINGQEGRFVFGCGNNFALSFSGGNFVECDGRSFTLPSTFDRGKFVQFRIIRKGVRADLFLENDHICAVPAEDGDLLTFTAHDMKAELEMVRYTLI